MAESATINTVTITDGDIVAPASTAGATNAKTAEAETTMPDDVGTEKTVIGDTSEGSNPTMEYQVLLPLINSENQ